MPQPRKEYPHLSHAPIFEALLDIRVRRARPVTLDELSSIHDEVKDRFPIRDERRVEQIQVSVAGQNATQFTRAGETTGFLFRSPAAGKILQARVDGFTLNKLKPYETWQLLRDEAKELWSRYRQLTHPEGVTRVALRYINRMELPLPLNSFDEYLRTAPQVAPELPQGLADFVLRLVIPEPEIDAVGVIHETFESPTPDDRLPFILDIDVFKNVEYSSDSDEIWADLENLREFKNQIFFNSTTEKAQGLFQ